MLEVITVILNAILETVVAMITVAVKMFMDNLAEQN